MASIEYNIKQQYSESTGDSATVKQGIYDEESQLFKNKHYGLLAQDLQKLYPDLVYESDNGYLSINYIGIIPLLIQSIKELKAEVDELNGSGLPGTKSGMLSTSLLQSENGKVVLFQNAPNPFNIQTTIRIEIPSTVQSAQLHICNMTGTLLKTVPLNQRGQGDLVINANEFNAGMYLYSLVCDGKIVDTKQMLLTE
jgi:hypothetical protein